jgi:hypothetical protein
MPDIKGENGSVDKAILSKQIHIHKFLKGCFWEIGSLLVRASEGNSYYMTYAVVNKIRTGCTKALLE